jgi:hypothetical protein
MNDFQKKLRDYTSAGNFDFDKGETVAQEVKSMYDGKMKRARVQYWWRFAVAVAIVIYGAAGIKYNSGWYVQWALFTAVVGVNAAFAIVLWYWQLDTKLGILKELKQLRIEIAGLKEDKENCEN